MSGKSMSCQYIYRIFIGNFGKSVFGNVRKGVIRVWTPEMLDPITNRMEQYELLLI
jgi:hypothetical protein